MLAADGGKYSDAEELFKGAILNAGREVDADLADNMLMDEVSVELQLGRTAKAAEMIRNIQHRDTASFAILQTLAGNSAAGEAYLMESEKYPQDTIEHDLRIPELKALIALRHDDPSGAIAALEPARPFDLGRCEVTEVRVRAFLAAGRSTGSCDSATSASRVSGFAAIELMNSIYDEAAQRIQDWCTNGAQWRIWKRLRVDLSFR
jgi:hypothetical protein